MTAVRAAVLVVALALAVLPITASGRTARGLVLGYYVPYDATSWASLEAHTDQLDIVAAQWVAVDGCGNLSSRDDQTLKALAQRRGVKLVPSVLTLSAWLNQQLLDDEDTSSHAIEQIVAYTDAEGYDGFDLDLEAVDPADRAALSQFVARTADALHERGKLLTLAIPAKEQDVTLGWAGAYDYAALGAAADLVTVMAYEYRGPFSGPGSVAPLPWVQRVTAYATSQIAPEKVMLGLAFYGYDWNTTSGGARALGFSRAQALAEHYQAEPFVDPTQQSLTFGYTSPPGEQVPPEPTLARPAHRITERTAPPCGNVPPPPAPAPTRRPAPRPDVAQVHQVWVEDAGSAAARLDLARAYGAGGVATWRLGLEDPGVWPLFETWRQG